MTTTFVALSPPLVAILAPLAAELAATRPLPPRWLAWLQRWTGEEAVRAAARKADAAAQADVPGLRSLPPPSLLAEVYLETLKLSLGDARETDDALLLRLALALASCERAARGQTTRLDLAARHRAGLLLQSPPEYVGGQRSCVFPVESRTSPPSLAREFDRYLVAGRRPPRRPAF